jgi:hypothetical protein
MTLTGAHVFMAMAAAAAFVGVILWRAPSLQAGVNRLKLIHNSLGIAAVFAGWSIGIAMFAWGVAKARKDLIYFSFLPMLFAGMTYNFITRRHATWYGLLGFDDSGKRWRSFWNETRSLWGLPARSSTSGASPPPPPPNSNSGPASGRQARSVSLSFSSHGAGASRCTPLIGLAASRLATAHITVFPNSLQFAIVLDLASDDQPHLQLFRQSLVVRRQDGGHLQLAVESGLAFLDATVGPRGFDGSYTIEVGLIAEKLTPGPFSGSIVIETGDPVEPQLRVPVAGSVE